MARNDGRIVDGDEEDRDLNRLLTDEGATSVLGEALAWEMRSLPARRRCGGAAPGAGPPHSPHRHARLAFSPATDDQSSAWQSRRFMPSRGTAVMAFLLLPFSRMIEAKSARPGVTPPSVRDAPPMRRRLATLFVDIAGSTNLLVHHPAEIVLGVVQGFMTLVTEVAFAHAGTVKDFEGDGALLYFASMKNAVRAALAIRRRLADGRCDIACGDGPGIAARMSVTVGDVVVGVVGSSTRRGIALIGPSVNIGARLLKHAPPGAIITSGEV